MVTFTDKGFTIEYETVDPIDEWLGLYEDISFVFASLTPEQMPREGLWRLAVLIEAMRPSFEDAYKMLEQK